MAIESDPDLINDPDRALEAKVIKQAQGYQESRVRSREENKTKAAGRKEIDKLGFRTDAYQSALRVARDLTPAEQKQYVRDFRFFLKVFGDKQQELWPEDAAKAAARAKRKAERKAKEVAKAGGESAEAMERRLAADLNPRSKPKASSAKPPKTSKGKPKLTIVGQTGVTAEESELTPAEVTAAQEQIEGGQILDGTIAGIPKVDADGKPLSQTAQAAAVREQLGLDNK